MDTGLLVAFWVVSFSLVMTPGADWAYAISAGLRERVLVPAVSGMLLGYLAITLVVAAGVGALVASVPGILVALTLVGAAYLLWLGVNVLLHPPGRQCWHRTGRPLDGLACPRLRHQRHQPEGAPSLPGAPSPVHEPHRELADRRSDHDDGPQLDRQLRRRLLPRRRGGKDGAAHPSRCGAAGEPGFERRDDRDRAPSRGRAGNGVVWRMKARPSRVSGKANKPRKVEAVDMVAYEMRGRMREKRVSLEACRG